MIHRHYLLLPLLFACAACDRSPAAAPAEPTAALTVELVTPLQTSWPQRVAASGHIAAWQEASVGSELGGVRLDAVRVNVGDRVRAGQLLAKFNEDSLQADLVRQDAAVAEARANLDKARGDAERGISLEKSGAISNSEASQIRTTAAVAAARLQSAEAQRNVQALQLKRARVLAPDDGIISARLATVGAVVSPGTELFRLIRRGRLEWRAEVPSDALARLKPGAPAFLISGDGTRITGTLRQLAPTVDSSTLTGIAYVELGADSGLAAGMFVSGEFELASSPVLALPDSAIVFRDGNRYVMAVDGDSRIHQLKVQTGRRLGDRVEVLLGLTGKERVAVGGGAFLNDGDLVGVASPAALPPAANADK